MGLGGIFLRSFQDVQRQGGRSCRSTLTVCFWHMLRSSRFPRSGQSWTGRVLLLLILSAAGPVAGAGAQSSSSQTIESIQFRGNRRVPTVTIKARIFTQPGDRYDENLLRRDFMALYNTGLFEDIVLHAEDGETGRIITFEVKEKPVIRSIEYKGNSSATHSDWGTRGLVPLRSFIPITP